MKKEKQTKVRGRGTDLSKRKEKETELIETDRRRKNRIRLKCKQEEKKSLRKTANIAIWREKIKLFLVYFVQNFSHIILMLVLGLKLTV